MRTSLSLPRCTIIPVLEYPDVPAAVKWLAEALAFEVRLRIGAHRAQLQFGGGAIVVSECNSPGAALGSGHSVMSGSRQSTLTYYGRVSTARRSFGTSRTFPTASANTPASILLDIAGRSPRLSEMSRQQIGAAS